MEPNPPVTVKKKQWNSVRKMFFVMWKGVWKRKSKSQDSNLPLSADYEFSCSNSPTYPCACCSSCIAFNINKRKTSQNHSLSQPPMATEVDQHEMQKMFEMLNVHDIMDGSPMPPSPPGLEKSSMVRQLRITDSPFPLSNTDEDRQVDKAAEEFIQSFYDNLRLQKGMAEKTP